MSGYRERIEEMGRYINQQPTHEIKITAGESMWEACTGVPGKVKKGHVGVVHVAQDEGGVVKFVRIEGWITWEQAQTAHPNIVLSAWIDTCDSCKDILKTNKF